MGRRTRIDTSRAGRLGKDIGELIHYTPTKRKSFDVDATPSGRGGSSPPGRTSSTDAGGAPHPKHANRDSKGRYTGRDGVAKDRESKGLNDYERKTGQTVDRQQRRATVDGQPHHRYFDGLVKNPDGTYHALEIKSGGASRSAQQRDFDGGISPDNPATVMIDGKRCKITSVELRKVT